MIQILNLYRFKKLLDKYRVLKSEAKDLLSKGYLNEYVNKLGEVQKVRLELVETANADY
ncbi:MAG: hypothetical protein HKN92_02700 [Chitinophagales bacterium]|nr:hypothetical protein [Chitinophagales bacterium]